ncbi:hypothetical protein [Microbulbifer sp. JMSA003]|uniref:hypothetical protein n=1 Tax=Microbulbifer sp. JMSA003 TaxID=3243369 RepID=UPI0040397C00
MYLRAILICLVSSIMVAGCAAQHGNDQDILPTINVGVQLDSPISTKAADILFSGDAASGNSPSSVKSLPVQALQRELSLGNCDVVIGSLSKIGNDPNLTDWESYVIGALSFNYIALKGSDHILRAADQYTFFSQVKSVGYVTEGTRISIDTSILNLHPFASSFVECGPLNQCLMMLKNGDIDALSIPDIDSRHLQNYILTKYDLELVRAKHTERAIFSIGLNARSLTLQERRALTVSLKKLFKTQVSTVLDVQTNNDRNKA